MHDRFSELLAQYDRIAVAGGPDVGKTTLANRVADRRVILAPEYEAVGVKAAPYALIATAKDERRFVAEGVWVARALRRGLTVDAVVYLHKARVSRTKRQIAMAKAVHTVLTEWRKSNRKVPVYVLD